MGKLIIVSNRLPVSVKKVDDTLEYTASIGGLSTALASYTANSASLWIGWPGIANDELTDDDRATITAELKKRNCLPIFLTKHQLDLFYNGYSNSVLWPLFHHLDVTTGDTERNWKMYQAVNQLFADVTQAHCTAKDTVWVHDYQLLLMPEMLRIQRPDGKLGFFLHIPFPDVAHLFTTKHAIDLLKGTLGADLVGVHTPSYAQNFINCCEEAQIGIVHSNKVALVNRVVRVTDFPISIDYEKFAKATKTQAVSVEYKKLQWRYRGKKVILMSDRLDPTKGLVERLTAYQTLLRTNPELHKKVVMAMIAMPSRGEIEAYKKLRERVEQLVTSINATFGQPGWQPIDAIFSPVPFEHYAALYRRADVAFIAPIKDGMNLVAKEFLASATKHDGVLVLSETAGAAEELKDAVMVNPAKPKTLVEGLEKALTMPKNELRRRTANMQRHIKHFNVNRWVESFVDTLEKPITTSTAIHRTKTMTLPYQHALLADYHQAKQRLLLFDYDGTLQPFAARPDLATPDKKTINLIARLSGDTCNDVVVISGRPKKDLQSWFGHLNVGLAAEHGALYRRKGGKNWHRTIADDMNWKEEVAELFNYYADQTPGAMAEHKEVAEVWHYRGASPYHTQKNLVILRRLLRPIARKHALAVRDGQKILEVKPLEAHKGRISQEWLIHDHDFVLCIGDDYTDEDMFAAVPPESYTIKVGRGRTAANYRLSSVTAVHSLLRKL
jgi:trehalose 6-phosphate synthase/phosphatase